MPAGEENAMHTQTIGETRFDLDTILERCGKRIYLSLSAFKSRLQRARLLLRVSPSPTRELALAS